MIKDRDAEKKSGTPRAGRKQNLNIKPEREEENWGGFEKKGDVK